MNDVGYFVIHLYTTRVKCIITLLSHDRMYPYHIKVTMNELSHKIQIIPI
jgi:hypothetical protein